jgi:ADP-ribose pyrophosphatase
MDSLTEETIATTEIYNGQLLNLKVTEVKLPNRQTASKEIVEHPGGVAVIPYQQGKVTLIKQFRKAVEETLYELPAGLLEAGEDPLGCAQRELEEETGYRAACLEKVAEFYTSPGFTNEVLYIYLATDLTKYETQLDKDEFIELEEMSVEDIKNKLFTGQFKDAKTIIGLQHLMEAERRG